MPTIDPNDISRVKNSLKDRDKLALVYMHVIEQLSSHERAQSPNQSRICFDCGRVVRKGTGALVKDGVRVCGSCARLRREEIYAIHNISGDPNEWIKNYILETDEIPRYIDK
jgi:hypothetical protein